MNHKQRRTKLMSNRPLLMLVDGSNLAYRSYYKFKKLRTIETGKVGLVYGFIKSLSVYIQRFKPTDLVITFDTKYSKKTNFRCKLLPDYKGNRKPNLDFDQEEFDYQLKVLQRSLRYLGIKQIIDRKGLQHESDDYLAYLALQNIGKTIIMSSDKDFVQLISKDIKMYHLQKEAIIVPKNCEKVMGFNPKQFLEFLILTGDTSDNIVGYRGIGPVRARQFFDKWETLDHFIKDKNASFPNVTKEGIEFVQNKNRPLVDLFYALKYYPIEKVPYAKTMFNTFKYKKLMTKHGLTSLISRKFLRIFLTIQ